MVFLKGSNSISRSRISILPCQYGGLGTKLFLPQRFMKIQKKKPRAALCARGLAHAIRAMPFSRPFACQTTSARCQRSWNGVKVASLIATDGSVLVVATPLATNLLLDHCLDFVRHRNSVQAKRELAKKRRRRSKALRRKELRLYRRGFGAHLEIACGRSYCFFRTESVLDACERIAHALNGGEAKNTDGGRPLA
ncbi:hypothetical protein EMIHUDRAFT_242833 [Emiliania huxleyi CCMP1516]|uniref:Uncharacterized protein n=2 Tax=Emiliania huxleyi TaxID=2903 RepID=A0A0D3J7B7_EMIH1|nr:hypothetical protein EMIHUDRAFT_242833 [Emiliania huxleyi CCMP1516]EOD19402.1 hypothetical protein EMIHUDRAFT_242833 [Emiliania huxleyi CCMP1516]|eukprot:XP_005771831.1 hypothetical protein EMIHUDRAFT_242833 [Emiliania huxleyi CCMP1516]